MNPVLERWNPMDAAHAASEILSCCGSRAWAAEMAARRPFVDEEHLLVVADAVWIGLPEAAWQEAFDSHPRIGEQKAKAATAESLQMSAGEQSAALSGDAEIRAALAEGNNRYEATFGRTFIVCASGKSAEEILAVLELRMKNDPVAELHAAAEQQRQISALRLERWLRGS